MQPPILLIEGISSSGRYNNNVRGGRPTLRNGVATEILDRELGNSRGLHRIIGVNIDTDDAPAHDADVASQITTGLQNLPKPVSIGWFRVLPSGNNRNLAACESHRESALDKAAGELAEIATGGHGPRSMTGGESSGVAVVCRKERELNRLRGHSADATHGSNKQKRAK